MSLNPFFIRSSIHSTVNGVTRIEMATVPVSIPSSSGQAFTLYSKERSFNYGSECLNPFFIRSSIHSYQHSTRPPQYACRSSQSLLHQVKHSLAFACNAEGAHGITSQSLLHQVKHSLPLFSILLFQSSRLTVSIPSSSGQAFTPHETCVTRSISSHIVSIPSSSGQAFTRGNSDNSRSYNLRSVSIPSSSGQAFTHF